MSTSSSSDNSSSNSISHLVSSFPNLAISSDNSSNIWKQRTTKSPQPPVYSLIEPHLADEKIIQLIDEYVWQPALDMSQLPHLGSGQVCFLGGENVVTELATLAWERLRTTPRRWYFIAVLEASMRPGHQSIEFVLNPWSLSNTALTQKCVHKIHYFVTKGSSLLSLFRTYDLCDRSYDSYKVQTRIERLFPEEMHDIIYAHSEDAIGPFTRSRSKVLERTCSILSEEVAHLIELSCRDRGRLKSALRRKIIHELPMPGQLSEHQIHTFLNRIASVFSQSALVQSLIGDLISRGDFRQPVLSKNDFRAIPFYSRALQLLSFDEDCRRFKIHQLMKISEALFNVGDFNSADRCSKQLITVLPKEGWRVSSKVCSEVIRISTAIETALKMLNHTGETAIVLTSAAYDYDSGYSASSHSLQCYGDIFRMNPDCYADVIFMNDMWTQKPDDDSNDDSIAKLLTQLNHDDDHDPLLLELLMLGQDSEYETLPRQIMHRRCNTVFQLLIKNSINSHQFETQLVHISSLKDNEDELLFNPECISTIDLNGIRSALNSSKLSAIAITRKIIKIFNKVELLNLDNILEVDRASHERWELFKELSSMKRLIHLEIHETDLRNIDCQWSTFNNLQFISFANTQIPDHLFSRLAKLPKLTVLSLAGCCGFDGSGFQPTLRFDALKMLDLANSAITDEALLDHFPIMPKLLRLNLSMKKRHANKPSFSGLCLTKSQFPKLRILDLSCTAIRDEIFAKLPQMPHLVKLILSNCKQFTGASLPRNSGIFPKLGSLWLDGTGVTQENLLASLPFMTELVALGSPFGEESDDAILDALSNISNNRHIRIEWGNVNN